MPSSAFKTYARSEEHTSELQSHDNLVCRLLLEKNTPAVPPPLRPHRGHSTPTTPAVRLGGAPASARPGGGGLARSSPNGLLGAVFFLSNRAPADLGPFPPPNPLAF